ncbi:MAG: helix-turn-helix domain-containing protein [Cyanobium sp.]
MPPLPSGSDALPQVAGSALGAVGAQLRQAREARGLAAEALAERLRIGVEQLQALENAETEQLPEPVFVIAQIRRVATALQLDIDAPLQALRRSGELERLTPRPSRTAARSVPMATPDRTSRPGARASGTAPAPPDPAGIAPAVTAAPAGQAPAAAARSLEPAPETVRSTSSRTNASRSDSGRSDSVLTDAVRGPGRSRWFSFGAGATLLLALLWGGWRLRQPDPRSTGTETPAGSAAPPLAPGKPPAASASPGGPTAETLELVSPEPSWVEVRRPDGTSLYRGLLNGRQQFPLGQGLEVLAGRPDLVRSRIGTGPSRALGPISEVRWWALRPQP